MLRELVKAAIGESADDQSIVTVRAFIDFEVYATLRDAGHSTAEGARTVAKVLSSGL